MTLHLNIEPRAGYLHVTATGAFTDMDEARAAGLTILRACVEHGRTRALVDLRAVTGQMPPGDRQAFGEFVSRQIGELRAAGALKDFRVVYVDNDEIGETERFAVTASRSRGLDAITTPNLEEAWQWLGVAPPEA